MNNRTSIEEIIRKFRDTCVELGHNEQQVLERAGKRLHISRNTNQQFDENLTFGQRLADKIAAFGGSWPFIILFLVALVVWVVTNSVLLVHWGKPFDPFPYILLNLFLSMLASLQAPLIMMSQNRQAAKDRLDAEHDYEVNLKAELEILALHEKLDILREEQWADLVEMQRQQIEILTRLLKEKQAPPKA